MMKKEIMQVLPLWGIEINQIEQIYTSAWEVNSQYVIKIYDEKNQLERNIRILTILSECDIPVAEIVPTMKDDKYVEHNGKYFFMSKKLAGSSNDDIRDTGLARQMGSAIARLHRAFLECEKAIDFWDNSLLAEMQGWIKDNLKADEWQSISEDEYVKVVEQLEQVYDVLPKQLIHRDVHFGNFLFTDGEISGYIDFDLSQRNIRIFDLCYFLTGLLVEETEVPLTKDEWLHIVSAVLEGYESIHTLAMQEKETVPCVMKCIEILFVAYYISIQDMKCADIAKNAFIHICKCEEDIRRVI